MPDVSLVSSLVLAGLGLFAGWLGAVIGIGGGVVIVPVLVLGFGYDIRIAVASSLIAVVATSTAAGSAYVGEGLANMRLGMSLEVATTLGGITGSLVAVILAPTIIAGVFAAMMLLTSALIFRRKNDPTPSPSEAAHAELAHHTSGFEIPGQLAGAYLDASSGELVHYRAERLGLGSAISFMAGALSGMLGVGGGFLKVPAMTLGMRVPIRVAAATSNFMIGVTAISSLFVYFARGYVHPLIAVPLALGVVVGATGGARMSSRVSPKLLTNILGVVLLLVAAQMTLSAFGISIGR